MLHLQDSSISPDSPKRKDIQVIQARVNSILAQPPTAPELRQLGRVVLAAVHRFAWGLGSMTSQLDLSFQWRAPFEHRETVVQMIQQVGVKGSI